MFGLFGAKAEIRRVNKGTPEVIEYASQCFREDTLRAIAAITAEHLERAHKVFEPTPVGAKRAIAEYQRLHKEARQRHDDVALTAFTLVMLFIRAELQGEACQSAVAAIDAFKAQWGDAES